MPLYPTPRPLSDPLVLERALSDLLETDWTVVQPASGLPAKKASLQTLRDFFLANDVRSLYSFGAVGDGVVDDTGALNDAIAWINAANYRSIRADGGNYAISEPLDTITGKLFSIQGCGATITQTHATDGRVWIIGTNTGPVVGDFFFEGFAFNWTGASVDPDTFLFDCVRAADFSISNIVMLNAPALVRCGSNTVATFRGYFANWTGNCNKGALSDSTVLLQNCSGTNFHNWRFNGPGGGNSGHKAVFKLKPPIPADPTKPTLLDTHRFVDCTVAFTSHFRPSDPIPPDGKAHIVLIDRTYGNVTNIWFTSNTLDHSTTAAIALIDGVPDITTATGRAFDRNINIIHNRLINDLGNGIEIDVSVPTVPDRINSHPYLLGDVFSVSTNPGWVFIVTTAGTTAASIPPEYEDADDFTNGVDAILDGTAYVSSARNPVLRDINIAHNFIGVSETGAVGVKFIGRTAVDTSMIVHNRIADLMPFNDKTAAVQFDCSHILVQGNTIGGDTPTTGFLVGIEVLHADNDHFTVTNNNINNLIPIKIKEPVAYTVPNSTRRIVNQTFGTTLSPWSDAFFTQFHLGTSGALAIATAAEYRSATADRLITPAVAFAAVALVALTDAGTIAVDLSTFINASVTLGGNRTLGNPSNTTVGKGGLIHIYQDGTGSRTLAYASNWKFVGGVAPVLTTTAGAMDVLHYFVLDSTHIEAWLSPDVK
jgi:hypothetical protein